MGKLLRVEASDSVLKSELRALKISCFPEHVVSFWGFLLLLTTVSCDILFCYLAPYFHFLSLG